jgi:hypothetical protein
MDEKYSSVKSALSGLCGVPAHLLRLAEVTAAQIKVCIDIYFWLWGWDWCLTELRQFLRVHFSSPDENEWMNGLMDGWVKGFFLGGGGNVEPTVEWYWQGKTEGLGEKPVPVPLCPPQIPLDWPGREPGERPATNCLSLSGNYILDEHAATIVHKYQFSACKWTEKGWTSSSTNIPVICKHKCRTAFVTWNGNFFCLRKLSCVKGVGVGFSYTKVASRFLRSR